MISNQWYVVLDSKELKRNKPLHLRRFGEEMVMWRDTEGKACCISDRCCHRGVSLSCGKTVDGKIECPFHGFLYDDTGRVKLIPANGKNAKVPETMKVLSYPVWEGYGLIWLWYGEDDKRTPEPFFFKELNDFSYSTFIDSWNVHYSRAIENQLDVVHLPFVHRTTIGSGNKTLVHGPVVKRDDELITFYVWNVKDDGKTAAKKPNEIEGYESFFRLQFHYPNIWQNFISDKIRAFAAFVPVDEENTLVYIRYYQRMIRIPLLRELFNFIGKVSSIVILRQDKRVVITQLPKKSAASMDERLIMGDKPIIEYRRHREDLINRAQP
jgi:phenylpropionate dioxygenase-like ring-hydroxylating dioxygenase large terminal subunit